MRTRIHMNVSAPTWIGTYAHTYTHTHTHAHEQKSAIDAQKIRCGVLTHPHLYKFLYAYIYIYVNLYMYTHICIWICIHTHIFTKKKECHQHGPHAQHFRRGLSIHPYSWISTDTFVSIFKCTHIYKWIFTHAHTYKRVWSTWDPHATFLP